MGFHLSEMPETSSDEFGTKKDDRITYLRVAMLGSLPP